MKSIELNDKETRMLCTAIRVVLGQINPSAKRIELKETEENLDEWAQLHMKVSCERCSLDDDDVCTVCGAEWGRVTPDTAQAWMNWVVTTGLYNRDGTKAEASALKDFVDRCAMIRDSETK